MNKSKMAFRNFVHIVRLHLLNYIGIAEVLKAYNSKMARGTGRVLPFSVQLSVPLLLIKMKLH
jgi:hypothetical protein